MYTNNVSYRHKPGVGVWTEHGNKRWQADMSSEQRMMDDGGQQTMNGGLRVNKWRDGGMQVTTGGSSSRGEQQWHPQLQPQKRHPQQQQQQLQQQQQEGEKHENESRQADTNDK